VYFTKGVTENKIVHLLGLVWLGFSNPRQGAIGRIIFLEMPKSLLMKEGE